MKNTLTVVFALLVSLALTSSSQASAGAGASVSGTIQWGKNISKDQRKLSPTAILFVFAKKVGNVKGQPPMAVARLSQPLKFPVHFSLSAENAMMPGMPFEGPMLITARISQSGSVIPASPGDIEGVTQKPVDAGSSGVVIQLDTVK